MTQTKSATQLAWRLAAMAQLETEALKLRESMGTSPAASLVVGEDDDLRALMHELHPLRVRSRQILIKIERIARDRGRYIEQDLARFEASTP